MSQLTIVFCCLVVADVAEASLSSFASEFKGSVKRTLAVITRDADIFVSIVVNIWIKWVSGHQL